MAYDKELKALDLIEALKKASDDKNLKEMSKLVGTLREGYANTSVRVGHDRLFSDCEQKVEAEKQRVAALVQKVSDELDKIASDVSGEWSKQILAAKKDHDEAEADEMSDESHFKLKNTDQKAKRKDGTDIVIQTTEVVAEKMTKKDKVERYKKDLLDHKEDRLVIDSAGRNALEKEIKRLQGEIAAIESRHNRARANLDSLLVSRKKTLKSRQEKLKKRIQGGEILGTEAIKEYLTEGMKSLSSPAENAPAKQAP
jgi:hypothetical protein